MDANEKKMGKLLVVDDDADAVEFFSQVGELAGFEVTGMTNASHLAEGLDPAPEVIILDLMMPDVDGIEVVRALSERKCRARLILVSGADRRLLSSAANLATRMGLAVIGEIIKPVSVDQLKSLLLTAHQEAPQHSDEAPLNTEELRRAVAENQFMVEYQPQTDLNNGNWVGLEALVRWNHPVRGKLFPGTFIPLLEQEGLGIDLTQCVLAHVVRDLPAIEALGFNGRVFVNLPPAALIDVRLADEIMACIDAAGISHSRIGFEVTETSLISDRAVAIDILARLRLKEALLAIDDFGTGHSSLEMLHDLPFTELKIDLGFVRVAETDMVARTIVENSIKLGRELGLNVVAEGIENAALRDWLRQQGCNVAQGYFIGRPMPLEALDDWYAIWQQTCTDTYAASAATDGFLDFDAPAAAPEDDAKEGERFRIFVVDDEEMMRDMIAEMLENDCSVETFSSAHACLLRLPQQKPNLLLCDVSMPVMNGYEFCRKLKSDMETDDIPVIFVSGEVSNEARLAGYEAGGEDFIAKPFDLAELRRKVMSVKRVHADKLALHDQLGFAQRTAFAAMSSMGELGVVIQLLRESFACSSISELAHAIIHAIGQYDLQSATQIVMNGEAYTLSNQGENIPLEVSVLNHLRTQGRIFAFKNRSVYNYGAVTVVINNMPLEDPDRCGRIRDNLAILAEGADARVQAIALEQSNRAKQAGIERALSMIRLTIARLRQNQREQGFQSVALINEMHQELIKSFIHLGLTEGQESFLTDLIQHFMDRLLDQNQHMAAVDHELESLATTLARLTG